MNDVPAAPGPAVEVPTGLYSQRPDVAGLPLEVVQAEYEALGAAKQGPGRLDRLEALAKRIHGGNPAPGAPGTVLKGDASAADPKGGETYEKALKGELGVEEQRNAMNARDAQAIREQQADQGMTEAEISEMEKAYEPKGPHEYKFDGVAPGQEAKVTAAQKLLFENGVSPQVANLLIQGGGKLAALSDDAFAARTDDAVKLVKALPGGTRMVADAHAFLTGLPDGHPLTEAAVIATATEAGIRELARLQRRKAATK